MLEFAVKGCRKRSGSGVEWMMFNLSQIIYCQINLDLKGIAHLKTKIISFTIVPEVCFVSVSICVFPGLCVALVFYKCENFDLKVVGL